jgi:hypothetical protein
VLPLETSSGGCSTRKAKCGSSSGAAGARVRGGHRAVLRFPAEQADMRGDDGAIVRVLFAHFRIALWALVAVIAHLVAVLGLLYSHMDAAGRAGTAGGRR